MFKKNGRKTKHRQSDKSLGTFIYSSEFMFFGGESVFKTKPRKMNKLPGGERVIKHKDRQINFRNLRIRRC